MAIYKLSMKVGKTNSKKHYEYISRTGSYKNYNKGEDLIYEKSLNLPSWANGSGKEYWIAVNDFENGTHYREFELTLPKELNHEENKNLLEEFCQETFGEKYTYSYSFHENIGKLSGEKNPHVHIMFSERIIDKCREEPNKLDYFKQRRKDKKTGKYKNGYVKDREITGSNRKQWLLEKRELWAEIQNKHLRENGKVQRVSHLSLKEQGIDRIPQIHLGASAVNMHLRGEETDRWNTYKEIEQDNIKLEKLEQEIKEQEENLMKEKETENLVNPSNKEILETNNSFFKEGMMVKYNDNVYSISSIDEISEDIKSIQLVNVNDEKEIQILVFRDENDLDIEIISEMEKLETEEKKLKERLNDSKERISHFKQEKYKLEEKIKNLKLEIKEMKEDKEILEYMKYDYIRWYQNVKKTKAEIKEYEEKDITSKILTKGTSQLFGKLLDRYDIEDEYEKYIKNKEYYEKLMEEKEEHKEHELYEPAIKEQEENLKETTKKLNRLNSKYNELDEELEREKQELNNIEYELAIKHAENEHKAFILNFKEDMIEKYRLNEKDAVQIEIGLNSGLNEYEIENILEKYIETGGKIDLKQEIDSFITYKKEKELEEEMKRIFNREKKKSRGWDLER